MKKPLHVLILLIFLFPISAPVQATSTEVWGQKFVEVTWTSSLTDWVCSKNIEPVRIFFTPSTAGDVFVLRENSVTGPRILKSLSAAGDAICIPFWGSREEAWKPCVKAGDQTFNAYGSVILTIEFK